jgi:hypothetical protein
MVLSAEQHKTLKQAGYRIKTFERVLKPGERAADGLEPDEPGGDYDSFPAVHKPDGKPLNPYGQDGRPRHISSQWESAWWDYQREHSTLFKKVALKHGK